MRQTEQFTSICGITNSVPVFLQKSDKLNVYISSVNSGAIILKNPIGSGVPSILNKYSAGQAKPIEFIASLDGFYSVDVTSKQCNPNNITTILSMVVEKNKLYNMNNLQTIGSIIVGLSGGFWISQLRNQFNRPLRKSKI